MIFFHLYWSSLGLFFPENSVITCMYFYSVFILFSFSLCFYYKKVEGLLSSHRVERQVTTSQQLCHDLVEAIPQELCGVCVCVCVCVWVGCVFVCVCVCVCVCVVCVSVCVCWKRRRSGWRRREDRGGVFNVVYKTMLVSV